MGNSLLTIDMISKEALRIAHEKATFIGTINRQFDDSFGQAGGKIGDTLRIRIPSEYSRTQGSRVMEAQDSVQVSTALTVATQDHVDMRFNSRELSLDLETFSKLHLEPAMAALVSGVDGDVLAGCTKATYNYAGNWTTEYVDNDAVTSVSSLTAPGNARTRMNQALAPKGDRRLQLPSGVMAAIVGGTAAYFNPSNAISEQYREGLVARTAMADYYENERVWNLTTISSISMSTAKLAGFISTLGQTALTVSNFTQTLPIGTVFTIDSVYDVHPETKSQYTKLKQFVVATTTSATAITISPAIYISGPRQNVGGTFTATTLAASSYGITVYGTTSGTFQQGLMYHRDAFTFATAELPLMGGADKCVRKTYDGLSLRVWQDGDIRNDELLTRIDILYGYAAIRPAWACRVTGNN